MKELSVVPLVGSCPQFASVGMPQGISSGTPEHVIIQVSWNNASYYTGRFQNKPDPLPYGTLPDRNGGGGLQP